MPRRCNCTAEDIIKLLREGLSRQEVTQQLGICPHSLWRILKNHGTSVTEINRSLYSGRMHRPNSNHEERNSEIAEALKEGISIGNLAKQYNLSRQTIHGIAFTYKIQLCDDDLWERNWQIIADRKNGMPILDLAEKYYLSKGTIQQILLRGNKRRELG